METEELRMSRRVKKDIFCYLDLSNDFGNFKKYRSRGVGVDFDVNPTRLR